MRRRRKGLRLVLDRLPARKKALAQNYVKSTRGKPILHFLLGHAPELNPDELVRSHVKRTGNARRPLQKGRAVRRTHQCLTCRDWQESTLGAFVLQDSRHSRYC